MMAHVMGRPPAKEKLNFHLKVRLRKQERAALEQKRAELKLPTLAALARKALKDFLEPTINTAKC